LTNFCFSVILCKNNQTGTRGNIMKVSIFASTVFAMTAWVSYANAEDIVPESTATLKECQAWAVSHQGTPLYVHANKRCEELKNCVDNESTGQLQLRACMAQAESQFYNAVNLLQPQTRPQAQMDQPHRLEERCCYQCRKFRL
jgi:hypothetical protein